MMSIARSPIGRLAMKAGLAIAVVAGAAQTVAHADDASGFLSNIRRRIPLTSSVPDNGDQNPYALVVAPVSAGIIQKNDLLIDNFNNSTNLQGLGTTIVDYNPTTRKTTLFAKLPRHLTQCPGGVGLTTAMVMLQTGWVIVGSTPSDDGTTRTKGNGCLMVINPNGQLVGALAGANINGPWGNMALVDHGSTAMLFVSNAGIDVPSFTVQDPATGESVIINKATVVRLDLSIPSGQPPVVTKQTVVANGFGQQADKGVFLVGPTGLAIGPDNTLYVSDAIGNSIAAVDNATTRTTSAGTGREVTKEGLLHRPLAMTMTPGGHLLVTNGLNGQVVEIDPKSGKQLYAQWVDANRAQTPPGSGDLFGIVMTPDGQGFYYVADELNMVYVAR
ncbi:MAG: hypothetical protein WDN49_04435 [Acetobacteraceae bacterium]